MSVPIGNPKRKFTLVPTPETPSIPATPVPEPQPQPEPVPA